MICSGWACPAQGTPRRTPVKGADILRLMRGEFSRPAETIHSFSLRVAPWSERRDSFCAASGPLAANPGVRYRFLAEQFRPYR